MENKINLILTAVIFLSSGVYMLTLGSEDYFIKTRGKMQFATVSRLPPDCKKRGNEIEVTLKIEGRQALWLVKQIVYLASIR